MGRLWDRNRRCRVCGKHRYATREAAEQAIAVMAAVGREERRAYPAHGWWHVTRQERRGMRKRKKKGGEGR